MGEYQGPILITGAARSGTSMTAGVVAMCGAWGGQLRGATKYNRKGMFENAEIVNTYVKPLLKRLGYDPLGQNPLPNIRKFKTFTENEIPNWRGVILKVIERQGYPGGPWYYKGAKICLMWPLWSRAFPDAKWIIVRRSPDDIVASCLRTSFMHKHRTRAGWLGWVAEHEKRFEEMHDAGMHIQEVWPQRAINGDLTELQMVVNNFGLNWDYDKIREFVTPSLWHRDKGGSHGSQSKG